MSIPESQPSSELVLQLVELSETALAARSLEEFSDKVLQSIVKTTGASSALLYVVDSRFLGPRFFQQGFPGEAASKLESICAEQFQRFSGQTGLKSVSVPVPGNLEKAAKIVLYPLSNEKTCMGLVGLMSQDDITVTLAGLWDRFLSLISRAINVLAERIKSERELAHLNAYLTVSSMLAQLTSLHELLETALFCAMQVVPSETASVLLLDDEKKNFTFYQVEGPTKQVLATATVPADSGIAGAVLQSKQSEVVNNLKNDPRFYRKIDSESGFQTRNMIAIPLVAGEERIGVLEVLNKVGGDSFTEDERLLLLSIAEEMAFAIRNAKVFEYVANSYCNRRQGKSCAGCKRPLGSWTPCLRYRESEI